MKIIQPCNVSFPVGLRSAPQEVLEVLRAALEISGVNPAFPFSWRSPGHFLEFFQLGISRMGPFWYCWASCPTRDLMTIQSWTRFDEDLGSKGGLWVPVWCVDVDTQSWATAGAPTYFLKLCKCVVVIKPPLSMLNA